MQLVTPTVITYHKISHHGEFGINRVDPVKFEDQINLLIDLGFNPVTFSHLAHTERHIENPIVITFDDGYQSVYTHAFPILNKYQIPAVVFVITDFIGDMNKWESFSVQRKFRHLSEKEILILHHAGWEIGSHSRSHPYLPVLPENRLTDEIINSKKHIENIINEELTSFCYPYGRFNERVVKIVRDSGYLFGTGSLRLLNHHTDPLQIERRSIYSTDSLNAFTEKLQTGNKRFSPTALQEWIIQKGTIPGILANALSNLKY